MRILLALVLAAGVGVAVGSWLVSKRLTARHNAELAQAQADKATLEAALDEARGRVVTVPGPALPIASAPASPVKLSPAEIIAKLVELKSAPAGQPRTVRQAVYWLEELIGNGPAALPAIREFLNRNEDLDFVAQGQSRGGQSILPQSLRFGLFDAVKQIGGFEAEKLLVDVLSSTGRGFEVAWLARALQEMAPNKYRDAAIAAARELLARPPSTNPLSALDRQERDQLFGVLTMYADTSYVAEAQALVVNANGEVDRSALKYLQQTLGAQSLAIAAQWYDDPRITDPANKEPFARLALSFVGSDPQAEPFYHKAINDMALTKSHRKNLIEDLNEDGLDFRNLTARDLPIIENRIALIERLSPGAADAVNAAAFKEAYKDLLNMRDKLTRPAQPTP